MSTTTLKPPSNGSMENVIRAAGNDHDGSINVNGFLAAKVGRKIVQTITTTNVANDTAVFAFSESGIALYTYTVIYTDATQSVMMSAERTA